MKYFLAIPLMLGIFVMVLGLTYIVALIAEKVEDLYIGKVISKVFNIIIPIGFIGLIIVAFYMISLEILQKF